MIARLGALLKWIILLPVLIVVLLLAVANDQGVTVRLNPFDPDDPVLRVDLALYQIAFAVFVLGALVGGFVAWSAQLRHRRGRNRREGADVWRSRPERPDRHDSAATPQPTAYLPRPGRG